MMVAHDPVIFPTDPHPVRPGTSAALTARTIDATIHPPLVQAQESVAALIPRLAVPLASPLLWSMLAGTLVLLWLARRAKFRPAGLLLPAAMLVTLTSFRPVGREDSVSPTIAEPTPFIFEAPEVSRPPTRFEAPEVTRPSRLFEVARPPTHRAVTVRVPRRERSLGEQLIASYPELVIVAQLNAERFVHDEKQLRAYVKDLNRRLRAEARRRARDWDDR
jgi:hypothetical protein